MLRASSVFTQAHHLCYVDFVMHIYLTVIQFAEIDMGARSGRDGARLALAPPPTMEFEKDNVICCSPTRYPNTVILSSGVKEV